MTPLNKNMLTIPEPMLTNKKRTKFLSTFRPKYNFILSGVGVGLIAGCLTTFGTNWLIPFIVPGFILQVPVNPSKFRESFIGKKIINFKFKLLSIFNC